MQATTFFSFSENYFTVKGAALILPQSDSSQRSSRNNGGDIQQHLQQMFYLLRPEDTIKVAVKLESCYQDRKIWRYMAVVCCNGNQDTEESIILGLDLRENEATIGLVLPVWANTLITLDGDGGFSVNSEGGDYLFKPVSVQAMWSALQSLHKVINTANLHNYIPKGLTHTWVEFYKAKINSDVSCIKEWNLMGDIESYAADSPYSSEKQELDTNGMKSRISIKLRELMMARDLEETTSKELRNSLEISFNASLIEYKSYIDQEMMRILGQMDAPSEILPYLYLGSEWNASNYDELEENGVNYILNVSREIDNFFPEKYHYMNVREFDNEQSDLMKHWKRTYEFIKKAKENNGKVLVHCKMGVSRSASTVIAFKMKEYGCSFQDAYKFVKEKRSVIRPNKAFMAQLVEYHGILTASRKRFLFGSKSSSEEVDMENGSGFNQLGNEARSLSGFTYYEPKDDPRFLPLDDDNCYAFDHSDLFYDRDDLFGFLEPGQPRTRAYTLDNTLPSKFKADDSWITLPASALHANLLQAKKQGDGLDQCDTNVLTNNMATDTSAAASLPNTKVQEVCSAADIRCTEMSDGSSKAPTSPSKMAKLTNPPLMRTTSLNGSKVTTSPLATTISADGSKVTTYPFAKTVLSDGSKVATSSSPAMTVSTDGSKTTTSPSPAMTVSSNGSKVATSPFTTTISSGGSKVAISPLATAVSSSDGSKVTASPLGISVSSNGSKVAISPLTLNVSSDSSKVTTSPLAMTVSSNGSKETNSPLAMAVSSGGSKEAEREAEDQAVAPHECGLNNNNDVDETFNNGVAVPVRYAKDNIPWNLGSVRKQREKMEEHIKTGSKTDAETVTEDDVTSWEILKKDEETPISDHNAPPSEQIQAPPTCFSTMHSSPPKLKTSHSFSSFPVGAEEAQEGTPAGGGAVCEAGTTAAERPQSVCLSSSGKDLLGTLGGSLKDSFQGSVHDPLFDPLNPVSLYEMEDIDLPAGIVRRTTKELEKKNRSSCHELTAVGLFHEETKKHPVQRSSSLGSESDRPRLERPKRRKTCTPILSPGNFGSSELLFYQQSGSLDCGDLFADEGPNSEMLHPLYPAAASVEDHLLSSYTEKNQVKDIMVYRYGAEQVEITGGSVRRRMKNYESLAKESFDKDTEDPAGLSESPNQTTLTTATGVPTTSSKAPTITTASTANIPITTASKTTSTCVSAKNTASTPAAVDAVNTITTAQLTPKALRKQEEFQGSGDKSQSLKAKMVKDSDEDYDPCRSKETPVTVSSKEQASTVNVNTLSSSEEPSILSGCVTKMTKHIEQMSKDPPPLSNVKELSSSKSHLFEGAAMSNALDSPLSCDFIEKQSECRAVASGKDSGSKNVQPSDETTATHFDTERIRLLKAKSMDESMLAVAAETVDLPPGDGKTVRHLVGKFDPNLVKELETGTAVAKRGDSPTPAVSSSDGGGLQSKMSEVVGIQGILGTSFHTSPKKIVPSEQKSSPRCSASQVLPNTFGAIDCPSSSAAESSSSVGVSKPLPSTTSTSHKLPHLPAATPFSTTSSITTTTATTTTTAAAAASVAMTTASIATATSSSSTAAPGGNCATASTMCATQTASVNTQASNVQSFQWWSQNTQCRTGGSTGPAPCLHSTSTSVTTTSTSASSSPPTSHNVPTAAAASSSSTSSLTCRPPFMLESRAFLQEGRKVRKLQGKTHPLSKLEGRQYTERRNANPSFYSTM